MKYQQSIRAAQNDPKSLEDLYQKACRENETQEFVGDLLACYRESPNNALYAVWYYRLQPAFLEEPTIRNGVNWKLAIPLSVAAGLILWLLTDSRFYFPDGTPFAVLVWAPLEACFVIAFLSITAKKPFWQSWAILLSLDIYTAMLWLRAHEQYKTLMLLHFPL